MTLQRKDIRRLLRGLAVAIVCAEQLIDLEGDRRRRQRLRRDIDFWKAQTRDFQIALAHWKKNQRLDL